MEEVEKEVPRTPRGSILGPPKRTPSSAKAAPLAHRHSVTPGRSSARRQLSSAGNTGSAKQTLREPPASATMRELPNATEAEYWLRRASRAQSAGDVREAERVLREGISRNARPVARLREALQQLSSAAVAERESANTSQPSRRALNFSQKDSGTQTDTSAHEHSPRGEPSKAPSCAEEKENQAGTQVVLTPVSAKKSQRDEHGSDTVVTPVRRSSRKRNGTDEGVALDLSDVLEQGAYTFSPNPALHGSSNLHGGATPSKNCAGVSDEAAERWTNTADLEDRFEREAFQV